MAVPFRRTGKTAKRLRRSHFKIAGVTLQLCGNCGSSYRPHHVCPKCGYYKGQKVTATPVEK
jgi:large subunit ribosomal protein L32